MAFRLCSVWWLSIKLSLERGSIKVEEEEEDDGNFGWRGYNFFICLFLFFVNNTCMGPLFFLLAPIVILSGAKRLYLFIIFFLFLHFKHLRLFYNIDGSKIQKTR